MTGNLDSQEQNEMKGLQQWINTMWKQEELYWKQRAHVIWLQNGDRKTKFFHIIAIQRR